VIVISACVGVLSAVMGLFVSIIFKTTPGPAMTLCATVFYFLAVLFSPIEGLIFKWRQNRVEKARIIREDILRQVIKRQEGMGTSVMELSDRLNLNKSTVSRYVDILAKSKLLDAAEDRLYLTGEGQHKAEQLVRAHRLWETYQVKKMGLSSDQIHNEADLIEHHLSEELLDEIDRELGFPTKDPHDSPIPTKREV